ncbi:MAG: TatD family hydrolase [Woeseia sp.]
MAHSLVDIGANLTHGSFDEDRDEVIGRAASAGVTRIIVTGTDVQSSRDALALANTMPGTLYATAGIHPHHASDFSPAVRETLSVLTSEHAIVAVGECGLDYFRNFSPPEAQRDAFEAQLDLAAECGLPVFLHQRDAHEEFVDILTPKLGSISAGVAHCFTGNRKALNDCLSMGLYIGITGWVCDERRGETLREVVSEIPLDRLMVETDSPYLLPRTLNPRPRSRRNEPVHLTEVLRVVAEAMGQPEEVIARATTENAERFFGLENPSHADN